MVLFDYTTSDEEFGIEEEDITMVLLLHKNKKPKHGFLVMGREYIWRQRLEAHAKLMANYFVDRPVFLERYFRRRFRLGIDSFKHIAECVKLHDNFLEQRRNCIGILGHSTYQKVTGHCSRWLMAFRQILSMIT